MVDTQNLATILTIGFIFLVILGVLYLFQFIFFNTKVKKIKTSRKHRETCSEMKSAILKQNLTDYFWSNHMRAAWITLFLTFTIALFFSLGLWWGFVLGIIFAIITFFFLRFAIRTYKAFPEKAAQALKIFEEEVNASLESEISFNGDNIQSFTDGDEKFDTKPQIFSFPANITKVPFPPYETAAPKQPIIATKKLEFLVLSREYFSICKNAATFNLLNPALGPDNKGCPKKKGVAGECHEHYYSQMRNVEYDNDKECIRILYYDERDDVEFKCKKPNAGAPMKALKEKLRLTERQRLRKIDEHEKYENMLDRREKIQVKDKDSDESE